MRGKLISAFFMCAVGLLIIGVAVSHKKDTEEKKQETQISSEQKKDESIKIWYAYKGYEDYILSAIEEYKKQNSVDYSIKLEYISEPGYFDYINEKSLEDEGPDIFLMGSEYLEKAYLLGLLEENFKDDIFNGEIYGQAAITASTYNNKLYAYPLGFDVSAILENQDYVSEEINTFEDIKRYADNFNGGADENEGNEKYANVKGILAWDVNTLLFNYGFIGNKISFVKDGKKYIDINNTEVINAAKNYLLLKDYFSLTGESDYEEVKTSFAKGEIVFILAATDVVNMLETADINYSVRGMLKLTDEIQCRSLSYTDLLAVNPRSSNKDVATGLAEFISYEYAANMYAKCGIISARKDITYDNEHINEFISIYDTSITMPKLLETEDYCIIMEEALKAVWNGESVETIFDELQTKYSERIK